MTHYKPNPTHRRQSPSNAYNIEADEERRAQERAARRAARKMRQDSKSVGATAMSASGINAMGLSGRAAQRPRGRGETARRVEHARAQYVSSRPAVYTAEEKGQSLGERLSGLTIPRPLIVVAVVAVAVAFAAGPARNWYCEWRESQLIAVEQEVVEAQNKELTEELDRLMSLEGVEDVARARGYVYPGEEALVANGVDDEVVADPAEVEEALYEHEANLPWYIQALDALFGYSNEYSAS